MTEGYEEESYLKCYWIATGTETQSARQVGEEKNSSQQVLLLQQMTLCTLCTAAGCSISAS